MSAEQLAPLIGGFFALEIPHAPGDGLLAHWGAKDPTLAWANATSALAALIAALRPARVWLPGYICRSLLLAVPPDVLHLFPLGRDFMPDVSLLDGRLNAGDVVLAVNMFGQPPSEGWRDFVAAHPGVIFVEDCAQALDPAAPAWGDWRLYSPRKLVGVPDGGLLVPMSPKATTQAPAIVRPDAATFAWADQVAARLAPALARLEVPQDNAFWHPLHQTAEAGQTVGTRPISRLSWQLLALHDPAALIQARVRNFRRLADHLSAHAVLTEAEPRFAPLGFPVALPAAARDGVLARLHARGLFPAVHWRDIPAPHTFAADHARAATLVTLPCDHRYGVTDMDRLAEAFLKDCI